MTSRSCLSGLITHDGAIRVTVDLLPSAEATALLRDVIRTARIAAEPEAAVELASRCDYLPLALLIAAERAATHPHATLAGLAGKLAVVHDRLDLLTTAEEEDEATAVRAFQLLGLHAGADISVPAAAASPSITQR